jgi:hypothetical protein
MLFDRAAVAGAVTSLLTPVSAAAPGTNTVYVVSGAGLAAPSWVQVGDGSNAEFRQITGVPAANHVSLRTPLQTSHLAGVLVDRIPLATVTGTAPSATPALDLEAAPGASTIRVSGPGAIAPGTVIRLGSIAGGDDEYVVASAVSAAAPAARDVSLSSRVQFLHPGGGGNTVDVMAAASFPVVAPGPDQQALSQDSPAGASVVFIANSANFLTAQDFVRIVDGASTEIRRIGALSALTLASSAYGAYAAGSAVDMVNLTLGPARNLAENATANSSVINVVDRTGLNIGDVVQIGPTADPLREILTIVDLPSRQTAPDAGGIVLSSPLRTAKTAPSEVRLVTAIARAAVPTTVLATPGSLGSASLIVTGGNLITAPSVLRIVSGTSSVYHVLNAVGPTAAAPVTLDSVLERPHLAGEAVTERAPLLSVRALDQGGWGDRLRVAIRDNDPPLVKTKIRDMPPDTVHLKLESANGVEEGTVLKRMSPAGVVVSQHKVIGIDRQSDFLITLDPATPLPMGVASGDQVLSHEFQLDVFLMRQPDPAVPTRAENVLMTESYPFLSMDPRHSRYIHKVIGTTWTVSPPATQDDETEPGPNPLRKSDRRSQGLSWLIRVHDVETVAANRRAIRLGPTPLEDVLPGGTRRPSRLPLSGGSDAVGSIIDKTFIGTSDVEPELRTGMFALENEEDISIVAVPGEIDRSVQGALITHCELLRYRFAVLDGPRPPNDTLADAQAQRQQFDTKYAAFYHPWILIPEPYPANLAKVADYPVPPSGHMLGVYARTDIDRGVHKAPANEVVRGIIGLQRRLNKSEQPWHPSLRGPRDHQRPRLEVRERTPSDDLHRGVDQPRTAMGGVRAQFRAAVGAGAPLHRQLPDPGVAQRRVGRHEGRRGVLREVRSHDHDPDGHR